MIEPIVGRYLHLTIGGEAHRLYFEEAGSGIPLICIHTAGADARQWRHLLNDEAVTRRFRIIAPDLPWHGKSTPPPGWQDRDYALSSDRFMETILALAGALGLGRPVYMGCLIGGNAELIEAFSPVLVGPRADSARIPGLDVEVGDGDTYTVGTQTAKVFDVPGHTSGHSAFWFGDSRALFCGDTLFALGCGRMFEGTAEQFWTSLSKLRALPDDTRVYCGHEYTQANARFAVSVDPDNPALRAAATRIDGLRARGSARSHPNSARRRQRARSFAPTTPKCNGLWE